MRVRTFLTGLERTRKPDANKITVINRLTRLNALKV